MKGTTLECFEDLMGRIQPLPEYFEKRKQLAAILGVEDSTIRRWMSGTGVPVGMSMISLRSYLDFLGYEVEEFLQEPEVMREASRMLAFKVLSLDDMTGLLDFGHYSNQVLAVLRGARGISKEREEKFVHMVSAYRQELVQAQANLPRIVTLETKIEQGEDVHVAQTLSVVAPQRDELVSVIGDSLRDEHFKYLTLMLLDHARYYTGSELSDEVREHLRSVVGQRNIFELKNLLVRLCGNTAFKQTQQ